MPQPGVVINTDHVWFQHFRPTDAPTVVDEVNFWRPQAQGHFRILPVGGPRFFRCLRVREESYNGRASHALNGKRIALPTSPAAQPSPAALIWHAESVFR